MKIYSINNAINTIKKYGEFILRDAQVLDDVEFLEDTITLQEKYSIHDTNSFQQFCSTQLQKILYKLHIRKITLTVEKETAPLEKKVNKANKITVLNMIMEELRTLKTIFNRKAA